MNKTSFKSDILTRLNILLVIFAIAAFLAAVYFGVDYLFKGIIKSEISRAVLSNFIVFATVIAFVVVKVVKPNEMIEGAQAEIEKTIKNSQEAKTESEERLFVLQEALKNIGAQIDLIFSQSDKNANLAGERILQDAHKTAESIQNDTEKAIENNQSLLKNDLVKRTSNAIIEIAKNQIEKELNNNPELHDKLIEESIEAMALNIQVEEV